MKTYFILTLVLLATTQSVYPQEETQPPCSSVEYSQFDFWLGEWTSYSADGKKQGTNHLIKMMGNCVMQENWSSGAGMFRGTSYNYYNQASKTWHQTWVDTSGSSLELAGGIVDGSMQLTGQRINDKAETVIDRITWTPLDEGRVRQHWQSSTDYGKNWSEVFDGYYVKGSEEQ